MGGLAAFASTAMLTTGFAVWVVGVQKTDQDNSVNVKVDTAQNQSISLNMTLSDDKIVLAESSEVTEGFVKAKGAEVVANPLQITFSSIKIEIGKEYNPKPNEISFSIEPNTAVTVSESKIGTDKRTTADSWTYIDAPVKIELPKTQDEASSKGCTWAEDNGNTTITFSNKTCDFTWGSFFGGSNTSPCAFYNAKFSDAKEQTFANSQLIQAELNAMHTALSTNSTINLKAELK